MLQAVLGHREGCQTLLPWTEQQQQLNLNPRPLRLQEALCSAASASTHSYLHHWPPCIVLSVPVDPGTDSKSWSAPENAQWLQFAL